MTPTPRTQLELEEFLSEGRIRITGDDGRPTPEFREFLSDYAAAVNRTDPGIAQQIADEVRATVHEHFRDGSTGNRGPVPLQRRAPGCPKAPGEAVEELWPDHGEFLQAVYDRRDRLTHLNQAEIDAKLASHRSIQSSFGTTIPADGGFLVPESMRQDIMTISLETAIVRPRATVIPMSTGTVTLPSVDETSRSGGTSFGGVTVYWAAEAGDMTETQAKFGAVKLEASKLTAFSLVPSELQDDSPAFLAWFRRFMPMAVSFKEDYDFTLGQGAGMPLGWTRAGSMISITRETGQSSGGDPGLNTIVAENIDKMYARMLPGSLPNAVWIASIDTFPQLASMARSVGTGGSAVWISNMAGQPPMTIYGRPVIFTEKAPTLGSAGDLSFVDLSYYGIGDRMSMSLESSTDYKFQSDQTAYRLILRVDGRPLVNSAITPANGGDTISPFVNIAQRTS